MFLFDLDGTLIDSNGVWKEVDREFLARRGLPYTHAYYEGVAHTILPLAAEFTKEFCHLEESCEDIIAEPVKVHGLITDPKKRPERVLALMREVGLDIQHMNRYPHEFSGGQRQRINVARALALKPKIIVCDEPVSALDVSIQAQVLNLFNRLQRQHNLTYIFISHDLGVIKHVSDRIAIMYLGRVVELCRASQIYDNPLHPYTKALLSAIPPESPFQKKDRIVLKGEIPSPIGEQVGCPLAGRCPNCMERCSKEIPVLKDTGDGHQVACFLYHDEAKA